MSDCGRIPGWLIHSSNSFIQEPRFYPCVSSCYVLSCGLITGEFPSYTGEEICVQVPQIPQGFGEATPIREMLAIPPSLSVSSQSIYWRLYLFVTFYWGCLQCCVSFSCTARESAICIHVSPCFRFPSRWSHHRASSEDSFLCCAGGSHYLSILYGAVNGRENGVTTIEL